MNGFQERTDGCHNSRILNASLAADSLASGLFLFQSPVADVVPLRSYVHR